MSTVWKQSDFFRKREQFRMRRLQVYNWGTFDGRHDIPIAERGFLFTGRSGSGKTTLLDAFSALLIPPKWVDFNAAARDSDRRGRDRNLASYVRGAWADQPDSESGEIATQYLRKNSTWSAIALTYQKPSGETVVLCRIFWLHGSANGNKDVREHFIIANRQFELSELEGFDLDVRRLKVRLPDVSYFDKFSTYGERFKNLLGIENELALRLLHKTQSAKNLGDLNTFLREFMLEKPRTFEAAKTLVEEFGELRDAHQAVVTAREQVEILVPAREAFQRHEELLDSRSFVEELRSALDLYRDERRQALLDERIRATQLSLDRLKAKESRQEEVFTQAKQEMQVLEERHRGLGGDRIELLEQQRDHLSNQRSDRVRRQGQARDACEKLGWTVPTSPERFATLSNESRRERETRLERSETLRNLQLSQRAELEKLKLEFDKTVREVEAMKRQPSNIPAYLLDLRELIARALNLANDALPFAGELMEVRAEESAWRGAAERALRPFALSVLVDEANYKRFSDYVEQTGLGARLVSHLVTRTGVKITKVLGADSLARKVRVEGRHKEWIEEELQRGFDFACVDNMRSFRGNDKSLTRRGFVRHNKTRHEKDDRFDVNERKNWVLGLNNWEKQALFEKQAHDLAEQIASLDLQKKKTDGEAAQLDTRAEHLHILASLQWRDIDVASIVGQVDAIERQLEEIRAGSDALREIAERLDAQRKCVKSSEDALLATRAEVIHGTNSLEKDKAQLEEIRARAPRVGLTVRQRESLDSRLGEVSIVPDLETLDRCMNIIQNKLHDEVRKLDGERNALVRKVEDIFAEFKRKWGPDAADMTSTMSSAPDFIAMLQRLELDGLPAHEQRFFELLRNQSHENLASLNSYLKSARSEIKLRMEWVNAGLVTVPFNDGTTLRIEDTDHQPDEVKDFRRELTDLQRDAWTKDREVAEQQFILLRDLVRRLGSAEPEHQRWRDIVLDVRTHVEFSGIESDSAGKTVEVYRSGAGKSGGQRQKLATTCLAAALRYQLGSKEHEQPTYAPVVLDEAFDKADNEFTDLAMNIFKSFGFQMIVATPLKSVMTLEPYIGGACVVDISDRRHSGVMLIEYDDIRQRLNLPEHTRHAIVTANA